MSITTVTLQSQLGPKKSTWMQKEIPKEHEFMEDRLGKKTRKKFHKWIFFFVQTQTQIFNVQYRKTIPDRSF